ncbi:MarR family transcriptional regulator [Celeribacter baekdonensis]|jgi:MarR family transcriptional regulator, transcriptional regulator for hemolysin|uniref:MarR family transcriptional regulator n=1 Tax=Celeribacter baekdonensis TaxID=875171 RepID=A0A2R4M7Q6_9RHOB|nr:MarR family transcriptional regulator [Celeribacter baekdonensis]AVW93127.1 MarR family transcriptional regulator [Celeribacter baekdonensis]
MKAPKATLHILHRIAHREWQKAAKAMELTHSEFEYLSAVQEQADLQRYEDHHGQHLQDIVETLGVTKASASAMIGKLEERGLLERFQCKIDARAQHIILTAEGQVKLARGLTLYDHIADLVKDELGALGLG